MAKVLVSLDEQLLRRLDAEAAARRISRSALIADLAAKGLGITKGPGAHPDVGKALKELDELFAEAAREEPYYRQLKEDSTATIRKMRDARYGGAE